MTSPVKTSPAISEEDKLTCASDLVAARLRRVPDFPEPGVVFEDLTPVLTDPECFDALIKDLAENVKAMNPDVIAGLDARGFLLGAAVSHYLGMGILPIRKAGKLPPPVYHVDYDLEYGSAALEIPATSELENKRVALIDDVLATGGTLDASMQLLDMAGAQTVGVAVVLEIPELKGRERLKGTEIYTVCNSTENA